MNPHLILLVHLLKREILPDFLYQMNPHLILLIINVPPL